MSVRQFRGPLGAFFSGARLQITTAIGFWVVFEKNMIFCFCKELPRYAHFGGPTEALGCHILCVQFSGFFENGDPAIFRDVAQNANRPVATPI